jgi:predicted nucleic acid-binding protein
MSFIKNKNIIVNIDEKIAEKAADISSEKNLPAIDSLIYATSLMNKLKLISLDNDFRGLDNVEILEI